jgi:hypothetical protein
MRPSATQCREQEALQQARAASEPLENRRKIALAAALAWGAEALLAEQQALKKGPQDQLDAAITLEFALEDATLAAEAADTQQSPPQDGDH